MYEIKVGKLESGDWFLYNRKAFQVSYHSDEGITYIFRLKSKTSYSIASKIKVLTHRALLYKVKKGNDNHR